MKAAAAALVDLEDFAIGRTDCSVACLRCSRRQQEVRSHRFTHFDASNQFGRYQVQPLHIDIIAGLRGLNKRFAVRHNFTSPADFRSACRSHRHIGFSYEVVLALV